MSMSFIKAPPKEIPKNIDSTYNNVVGYNGLIYYKGTVKATQGTKNVSANCQKGARLPTQVDGRTIKNKTKVVIPGLSAKK